MEIQWALILFTVISGAGAWLFGSSMIAHLAKKAPAPSKLVTIVSFVLLAVGGCCSVLHLSHPDRIMEALNHPTSGIFIEAAMIGVTCALLAVYFIMMLKDVAEKPRLIIGVIGALVGIVFTYACGSSYMMQARPAWMTAALPLAYFGTAAGAGASLYLFMAVMAKKDEAIDSAATHFAAMFATVCNAAALVLSTVYCAMAGSFIADSINGASGWTIACFAAICISIACSLAAAKKGDKASVLAVVALIAALFAAIAVRVIMWLIGIASIDFFLMPL